MGRDRGERQSVDWQRYNVGRGDTEWARDRGEDRVRERQSRRERSKETEG
jgi:hypothetical protein